MGNYKQLIIEERSFIQSQLTLGFKPSWIAVGLGRSISTISRELRCNEWVKLKKKVRRGRPAIAGKYRALLAQGRADGCQPNLGLKDDCKVAMCFGKR